MSPLSIRDRLSRDDSGFSLIEVVMALLIIAIVTTASLQFFLGNIRGVNAQKQRQQAVFLVDQQLESIKALPANQISQTDASSLLVWGRTQAAVQSLYGTAAATRLKIASQDDTTSTLNFDPTTRSKPAVPTTTTIVRNGVTYTLSNFVDVCWLDPTSGQCSSTKTATTTEDYRVSVDVAWNGANCQNGCDYSDSTIVDPNVDSLFNTNIIQPTGAFEGASDTLGAPALANTFPNQTVDVYDDNSASTCKPNTTTYNGTLLTVNGTGFRSNMTAKISNGGGSVVSGSVYQPSDGVVELCLVSGDIPDSFTLTLINADGGHFQLTVVEVPGIFATNGWTPAARTLTLTGGGFEAGATVSQSGGTGTTSFSAGTLTPATKDTLTSFVGPTNGKTATLKLSNPDGTSASYTITAPTTTTTATGIPVGKQVSVTVAASALQSGFFASATGATLASATPSPDRSTVTLLITGTVAGTPAVVTFANPDGGTATVSIPVDALPVETSLTPNPVTVNSSTTVTVTGTGFQPGITAGFVSGSGTVSTTFVSATSVKLTVKLTAAETATFTLTNPDGGVSNSFQIKGITPPVETSLTPDPVTVNTSTTVTVTGTGFQSGITAAMLTGSGTVSTTFVSATSVKLTVKLTAAETATFSLTNPDGGVSNTFSITGIVPPNVTSLTPTTVTHSTTTTFKVLGTGFQNGATIQFVYGGTTLTVSGVTFKSSTEVDFTARTTSTTGNVSAKVTETNPDGGTDNDTVTIRAN